MTKKTYHEGAEAERKAFKAYLKRQLTGILHPAAGDKLKDALVWVQGRCDRYHRRKGGL